MAKPIKQMQAMTPLLTEYSRLLGTEFLATGELPEAFFKPAPWTNACQAVSGLFYRDDWGKYFGMHAGNAHPVLVQYANMSAFWQKRIPNFGEIMEHYGRYPEYSIYVMQDDVSMRRAAPTHIAEDTSEMMTALRYCRDEVKKEFNSLPIIRISQAEKLSLLAKTQVRSWCSMFNTLCLARHFPLFYMKECEEAECIDATLLPDNYDEWLKKRTAFTGAYAMVNERGITDSYCLMRLSVDKPESDTLPKVYLTIGVVPCTNFPGFSIYFMFHDGDHTQCDIAISSSRLHESVTFTSKARTPGVRRVYGAINQLLRIANQIYDGKLNVSGLKNGVYYSDDTLYTPDVSEVERYVVGLHAHKHLMDYDPTLMAADLNKPVREWVGTGERKQKGGVWETDAVLSEEETMRRIATLLNIRDDVCLDWRGFEERYN